jgi:hypothetical protein
MQSRLHSAFVAVAVAAGLLSGSPRASANYVLDSFDSPTAVQNFAIADKNANPYTLTTNGISPGVDRTLRVEVLVPNPANAFSATGHVGGGDLFVDADNASTITATLTYTLTGSAQNLTGSGAIDLGFKNLDAGNSVTDITYKMTVVTSDGTYVKTGTINESTNPFTASLSLAGVGGLSQVSSISIQLNDTDSRVATDYALDSVSVRAVPAPPAVVLAGIGFVGLIGRSRLLRRKTA